MKKSIAALACIFLLVGLDGVKAQNRLSLSVYAGSGISKFGGPGATSKTKYFVSDVGSIPSTAINPYGNQAFQTWQAGIQAQYRLDSRFVFLFSTQYEHTGGSQEVDTIISIGGPTRIDGEFTLFHDFISVNPQFGAAIINKSIRFLVNIGLDYCFRVEQGENLDFTDQNGDLFAWGSSGGVPANNEFRVTGGMQIDHKRIGLGFNYKHGLTNARDDEYGKDVYSRIWQFNLYYKFLRSK